MVGDWYKTEQEVQLSPIVIPVSVPVSSKDAKTFNKFSRQKVKTFTFTILYHIHIVFGRITRITHTLKIHISDMFLLSRL